MDGHPRRVTLIRDVEGGREGERHPQRGPQWGRPGAHRVIRTVGVG